MRWFPRLFLLAVLVSGPLFLTNTGPDGTTLFFCVLVGVPGPLFLWTLLRLPAQQRRAGELVLQSGPPIPSRGIGICLAVAFFALVIVRLTSFSPALNDLLLASIVVCGVCTIVLQRMGTRICENGILRNGGFLAWDRIVAYRWVWCAGDSAELRLSTGAQTLGAMRLRLTRAEKDIVDRLLTQRLPGRAIGETPYDPGAIFPRRRGLPWLPGTVLGVVLAAPVLFVLIGAPLLYKHILSEMPTTADAPAPTRDGRWRQDLQYLSVNVQRLQKNPFVQTPKVQFDQAVAQLDAQIPTLSDDEVILRMDRLVAMIGDAHSSMNLDLEGSSPWFRTYPLQVQWFSDGLYVTEATETYRAALGARVLRIGSMDAEQAEAAVSGLIAHENDAWVRQQSPAYLLSPEILQSVGAVSDPERAVFVFERTDGTQLSIELTPLVRSRSDRWEVAHDIQDSDPLYLTDTDSNYDVTYLDSSRTLYIIYNQCQEDEDESFADFVKDVSSQLHDHRVDRLIVDLRNNNGGDPRVMAPLLSLLAKQHTLAEPGHSFVVVGQETFSAAVENAVQLRSQLHAVIAGEPTGGKPNFYGGVRSFKLPNSGIAIDYATQYVHEVPDDPVTLVPDLKVPISWADYLAGRDPVLDAILAYHSP